MSYMLTNIKLINFAVFLSQSNFQTSYVLFEEFKISLQINVKFRNQGLLLLVLLYFLDLECLLCEKHRESTSKTDYSSN